MCIPPSGETHRREVTAVKVVYGFLEAIVASMIGYYACQFVDDVVKLLAK